MTAATRSASLVRGPPPESASAHFSDDGAIQLRSRETQFNSLAGLCDRLTTSSAEDSGRNCRCAACRILTSEAATPMVGGASVCPVRSAYVTRFEALAGPE